MVQSAFVVPAVPFQSNQTIRGSNTNNLSRGNSMNVAQQAMNMYQNAPTPAKAYVRGKVSEIVDKTVNRTNTPSRSAPTPPRGGGGRMRRSESLGIGYGLSTAPNPAPVNLNTGIKPNTYTSDFIDTDENMCSPLHITAAQMVFPTDALQNLATYIQDIAIFDMQTSAQANVSFNLNISTIFTTANISNALNNIFFALQIHYWYQSIITYHSSADNKNEGMIYLRRQISATDIENLNILKLRLQGTPIPPNLLQFVRYMGSNWFSGDTQGSPILKIAPQPILSTGLNNTAIVNAINSLSTTINDEVFSLMRRSIPSWKNPDLSDVPLHPVFDKNFLTIWTNLPFKLWNSTTTAAIQYPQVATKDETISYNNYTNNLDGLAYCMLGFQDTTAPTLTYPGLVVPSSNGSLSGGSTRRSYYEVSGAKSLYDANIYPFLTRARSETYYVSDTATFTVGHSHNFGTDKCQGVSANTVKETAFKAVDYLFSLSTIKQTVIRPGRNTN